VSELTGLRVDHDRPRTGEDEREGPDQLGAERPREPASG
jgi:hypothetical protein